MKGVLNDRATALAAELHAADYVELRKACIADCAALAELLVPAHQRALAVLAARHKLMSGGHSLDDIPVVPPMLLSLATSGGAGPNVAIERFAAITKQLLAKG